MPDEFKGIELLLKQQQEFTKNLLTQQQQWMQSILENKAGISAVTELADNFMVPAFHKFNKEHQQWESYLQQLEQHFFAYSVTSAEKKIIFSVVVRSRDF